MYTPYYAAHIIGSYTMNKPKFADKSVKSNVVQPLIELLRARLVGLSKELHFAHWVIWPAMKQLLKPLLNTKLKW